MVLFIKMLLIGVFVIATPIRMAMATGKTGAELLQDPEIIGIAFVWGATNYMVSDYSSYDKTGNRLTKHRENCIVDSGINAKTIYDAVVQSIRSDPAKLALPVSTVLQNVTYQICGAPPAN